MWPTWCQTRATFWGSERAQAYGSVKLSQAQWDDLALWEIFLDAARKGMSMNRLVCWWPTRIVRVDAFPHGIWGCGLQSGVAWRYRLEPDLIGCGTLNCLEFLAALVGVWVEHQLGGDFTTDEVLLLCQGDSSSALGWPSKSSFGDEGPLHLAIARSLASYLIKHEILHDSQWFPGKENSVADVLLSRDFGFSDADVVSFARDRFTNQKPQHFCLVC